MVCVRAVYACANGMCVRMPACTRARVCVCLCVWVHIYARVRSFFSQLITNVGSKFGEFNTRISKSLKPRKGRWLFKGNSANTGAGGQTDKPRFESSCFDLPFHPSIFKKNHDKDIFKWCIAGGLSYSWSRVMHKTLTCKKYPYRDSIQKQKGSMARLFRRAARIIGVRINASSMPVDTDGGGPEKGLKPTANRAQAAFDFESR